MAGPRRGGVTSRHSNHKLIDSSGWTARPCGVACASSALELLVGLDLEAAVTAVRDTTYARASRSAAACGRPRASRRERAARARLELAEHGAQSERWHLDRPSPSAILMAEVLRDLPRLATASLLLVHPEPPGQSAQHEVAVELELPRHAPRSRRRARSGRRSPRAASVEAVALRAASRAARPGSSLAVFPPDGLRELANPALLLSRSRPESGCPFLADHRWTGRPLTWNTSKSRLRRLRTPPAPSRSSTTSLTS